MTASNPGHRRTSHGRFVVLAALMSLGPMLVAPAAARAQTIRGEVRDSATRSPIARATVSLFDAKDSTLKQVITSDSGRFTIVLTAPGTYALDVRRVGWQRITTAPFKVRAGDSLTTLQFEMARQVVALDTVISRETRGVFAMTSGRDFVRKHFVEGIGTIISGWEIEKTGLKLSEYLGLQAGLHVSAIYAPGTPLIPADHGAAILSDVASQCLYARIDRFSVLYMLMNEAAETIDEVIKVKDIMAVEVYLDQKEVPKEWAQDAYPDALYTRLNGGRKYVIGHTGFPTITADMLLDEPGRFATQKVTLDRGMASMRSAAATTDADGNAAVTFNSQAGGNPGMIPPCGFLQIWTARAW